MNEIRNDVREMQRDWVRLHRWPLVLTLMMFVLSAVGMIGSFSEVPVINPSPIWLVFRVLGIFGLLLVPVIAAIWCSIVFRRLGRFLVFLIVLLGPAIWIALIMSGLSNFNWEHFAFPFAIAIPVVVSLEGIKVFGQYKRMDTIELKRSHADGLQFGMKHLFVAMTVSAVIFGFRDYLFSAANSLSSSDVPMVLFCIVMVGMAILSVWAMLGSAMPIRLLIATLLSGGLVVLFVNAGDRINSSSEKVIFAGTFSANWIAMTLLLFMLRRVGYRFVKRTERKPDVRNLS